MTRLTSSADRASEALTMPLIRPLRWRAPRFVRVDPLDLAAVPADRRRAAAVWAIMALAGRHTFQVTTAHAGRLAAILAHPNFLAEVAVVATDVLASRPWQRWQLDLGGQRLAGDSGAGSGWTVIAGETGNVWVPPWPLPHVWIGTTIETGRDVRRAEPLRTTPASIRFVSCEPLLGPLDHLDLTGIDWLVFGGATDRAAQLMDPAWAQDLLDRCSTTGVPAWATQAGRGLARAAGLRDPRGQNPAEWPWRWPRDHPAPIAGLKPERWSP